jgi:hypothetical protein
MMAEAPQVQRKRRAVYQPPVLSRRWALRALLLEIPRQSCPQPIESAVRQRQSTEPARRTRY